MENVMNNVKVSTKYSSSIKVKNKTFVLYLRNPSTIEVYGNCTQFKLPFENSANEAIFNYTDEIIWNACKQARKEDRKRLKEKQKQCK
jgi:hypothetical protein